MTRFYTSLTKQKDKIVERFVEDGIRKKREVIFQPKLYTPSVDQDTPFKSLSGLPLREVKFDNLYAMDQWLEEMKNVPNYKIYGIDNVLAQYVAERYPEKQITFNMKDIRGAIVDIEVESGHKDSNGIILNGPFPEPATALYEITSITVFDTMDNKFYVYGLEWFKGEYIGTFDKTKLPPELTKTVDPEDIIYRGYESEHELLLDFVDLFEKNQYDYISGWHSDPFDIPYFCNRIDALLGRDTLKRISPLDFVRKRTFNGPYGEEVTFSISGVSNLDLKDIIDKHAFVELDNKKLNTAAEHFLGEAKVEYQDKYKNLTEFYYLDYQNYIGYNIHDVNLVKLIAEKTKMLQLAYTLAFLFHCNPDDTNATVLPWQYLMYCYGARNNEFSEIKARSTGADYPGGYVKDVVPGRYEDVVSVDANALN